MRRTPLFIMTLALTSSLIGREVRAQDVGMSLRAVGANAFENVAGTDLDGGFGFGAVVSLRVLPHTYLYGGWDWIHFAAASSFAGADHDFEETGYTFGASFMHPIALGAKLSYRLEAGGTYKHVEVENDDGDIVDDTGHELGYELGAGVSVALANAWRLSPMIRYRNLQLDFPTDGVRSYADFRYVALELGVTYQFTRKGVDVATRH